MAGKISFACPGCSAKFSVTDKSKLGKKIRCPKCQEVFTPEIPDDDDDEMLNFENENEDEDDDQPVEPIPRRKGVAAGSGGKGQRRSGKSNNGGSAGGNFKLPMIVGGVVLVVLIGVGLAFTGLLGGHPPATPVAATLDQAPTPASAPANAAPKAPSTIAASGPQLTPVEKMFGLRWMPVTTDLIVHVKVAELWKAPLLKRPLAEKMVTDSLEPLKEMFELVPVDVESITVGLVDAFKTALQSAGEGAPAAEAPANPSTFSSKAPRHVMIIKTKKSIDLKKIAEHLPESKLEEKFGKSCLIQIQSPTNPQPSSTGFWSPNPNTLIGGTVDELFTTMERGEVIVPRREFASIEHLPQIVIALVLPDFDAQAKIPSLDKLPGSTQVLDSLKADAIKMASLGLSIKGGFDLRFSAMSASADAAKNLKTKFESGLTSAREVFNVYKTTSPPLLAELGEMLLTNARVVEQNQTTRITTNVPDSAQAKLEQLPPILMMMAMTSGFMPGPGSGSPADSSIVDASKQPGETAAVEPLMVEGLPEGMSVSARSAWSTTTAIASDGTPKTTMDVLIDVTGTGVDTICGSAGISPKLMSLEGGGQLRESPSISAERSGTRIGIRDA